MQIERHGMKRDVGIIESAADNLADARIEMSHRELRGAVRRAERDVQCSGRDRSRPRSLLCIADRSTGDPDRRLAQMPCQSERRHARRDFQPAAAGAQTASWVMLRLASPLDQLFSDWLEKHFPDRAARVLGRIRECRGGKLNDTSFRIRQRGMGPYATQIANLFAVSARRRGLDRPLPPLNASHFRRVGQLELRLD